MKVALFDAPSTLAPGTELPPESFTVNTSVSASMAPLKVAVAEAVIAVPVAADCGEMPVTVGGVVLAVAVSRTASTQ